MVKYFFFDCFQVFFGGIMDVWVHETFSEEEAARITATFMVDVDKGKMSLEEFCGEMSQLTGRSALSIREEFHDRIHPNREMIDFQIAFAKNHATYMLSNASKEHFHDVLDTEPGFKASFRKIYVSAEIGRVKPTAAFYQYVLDDLHVPAGECVMVDDRQVNLDGAASLGIHTLLFKDYGDFKKKMDALLSEE